MGNGASKGKQHGRRKSKAWAEPCHQGLFPPEEKEDIDETDEENKENGNLDVALNKTPSHSENVVHVIEKSQVGL